MPCMYCIIFVFFTNAIAYHLGGFEPSFPSTKDLTQAFQPLKSHELKFQHFHESRPAGIILQEKVPSHNRHNKNLFFLLAKSSLFLSIFVLLFNAMTNLALYKRVDGVFGVRTRDCRMVGADESTE